VSVIKSRRLRLTSHVVRMEEVGDAIKISRGKPTGRDLLEDLVGRQH